MARLVVLGASGTGKSWYSGKVLEDAAPTFDFAVHFDPEDEEVGLSAKGYDPLYRTLRIDQRAYRNADLARLIYDHRRVRIVPEGLTVDEMIDLYAKICGAAMALAKDAKAGTILVSCDEAHNVVPEGSLDQRVERLITGGRKHGAETLHISQRPQLLHKTVLSQTDKAIYFRISENNDISKINKSSVIDATKLKNLPKRTCLIENRDSGDWKEQNTEELTRVHPHFSGDDGLMDEVLPV